MVTDIKIGDKFFKRKESWRRDKEPYDVVIVKGETSRSWILGMERTTNDRWDFKIAKNDPFKEPWKILTQAMIDDQDVIGGSYKLGERVQRLRDVDKLKQIAAIMGNENLER